MLIPVNKHHHSSLRGAARLSDYLCVHVGRGGTTVWSLYIGVRRISGMAETTELIETVEFWF